MERFLYKAKRKDNGEWVIGYYYKQQIVKNSPAEQHFIKEGKEEALI